MNKLSIYSLSLSFISLMIFWIIMSGLLTFIHIGFGVVTVALVMFVNYQLKTHRFFHDDMDDLSELRITRAVYYVMWMVVQIVAAGFHVAYIILSPSMKIHTTILKFKTDLPSAHARMILGNSITLTPGTLTVDIEGEHFTVHSLDDKSCESLVSDKMPREVLKLFQKDERQVIHEMQIVKVTEPGS